MSLIYLPHTICVGIDLTNMQLEFGEYNHPFKLSALPGRQRFEHDRGRC